jgi:hypothetical protein
MLANIVADDDLRGSSSGRPILYGFGYRYLLRIGRVAGRKTLRRTILRGVPLHDPIIAIAWGLARRGKRDLAAAVLREFGYSSEYRVCRRSIFQVAIARAKPVTP